MKELVDILLAVPKTLVIVHHIVMADEMVQLVMDITQLVHTIV